MRPLSLLFTETDRRSNGTAAHLAALQPRPPRARRVSHGRVRCIRDSSMRTRRFFITDRNKFMRSAAISGADATESVCVVSVVSCSMVSYEERTPGLPGILKFSSMQTTIKINVCLRSVDSF